MVFVARFGFVIRIQEKNTKIWKSLGSLIIQNWTFCQQQWVQKIKLWPGIKRLKLWQPTGLVCQVSCTNLQFQFGLYLQAPWVRNDMSLVVAVFPPARTYRQHTSFTIIWKSESFPYLNHLNHIICKSSWIANGSMATSTTSHSDHLRSCHGPSRLRLASLQWTAPCMMVPSWIPRTCPCHLRHNRCHKRSAYPFLRLYLARPHRVLAQVTGQPWK